MTSGLTASKPLINARCVFIRVKYLIKLFVILLCFTFLNLQSIAQLPECGLIYSFDWNAIYNYDPSQPASTTYPSFNTNPSLNTIPCLPNFVGLAVSDNLNAPGPSPTFYTTVGGYYFYYNGTGWVNTTHKCGSSPNLVFGNIGAGGGYIYSFETYTGNVYRYDGTGDATFLFSTSTGPSLFENVMADIAADCQGNVYLVFFDGLRKYSPSGILLQTWALAGNSLTGGGIAFSDNTIFTDNSKGVVDNALPYIFFTPTGLIWNGAQDLAACPGGNIQGSVNANLDTGYYCGDEIGIPITAIGNSGPISLNWSVLDGQGFITGSGSSINVISHSVANILLSSTCYNPDTVTVINTKPTVDAGSDRVIAGCHGIYHDLLNASMTDTIAGVNYQYNWSPASAIVSGANSLDPVISPSTDMTYLLTVSTPADEGGCSWTDSLKVTLADSTVIAGFSYDLKYGCYESDTVAFYNNSSGNTHFYNWDFGDGTFGSAADPVHFYPYQEYNVLFTAKNTVCKDTISKLITAPSHAESFDLGDDLSICNGDPIQITLYAKISPGAIAAWNDGSSLPYLNIRDTGVYWVTVANTLCLVSDTIRIKTELCDCTISVPTAFSPNGDGHNDLFRPVIENGCIIRGYIMSIYNRWGQLVYTGSNASAGWDGSFLGEPADVGNYMYVMQLEAGTRSKKYQYKGDIVLIR